MVGARLPAYPPNAWYRIVRWVCALVVRVLFDVRCVRRANFPAPGSIVAGVPHRNWVEPALLMAMMPARPGLVWIGDGPAVSRSFAGRLFARLVGGVIPVWPRSGAAGFEAIARQVNDAVLSGAVVAIFPEVGSPSRPPELRKLSPGVAHLAARSGASLVPVVFGGTHELYLRRGIVVRLLPVVAPPVGTTREAIDMWMADFRAAVVPAAAEAHLAAESGAPSRKWWRWLTGNFPRA